MYILGISAFYHDSAACLLKDGDIIAASQEERFVRKKHYSGFPKNAVFYCLREAGINLEDLDYVAFYDKPFVKFDRIIKTHLAFAPWGIEPFIDAVPFWLKHKLWVPEIVKQETGYKGKVLFPEHHESHAASAFFPSPFKQAAFLTMDGVGEWATASYGIGKGNRVEIKGELKFPNSLGLLYSAFTYFLGFRVNSGEYKVMGLAPYGEPKYVQKIYDNLIDLKEDGSFRVNLDYFNYCTGSKMINQRFEQLFDGPARSPESKLTQREMDIARSIQEVTEEVMLRMARHVKKETAEKYLCLAGGVALNCVGNGKLLRSGLFDDIWVQPSAGDAGGALGAAYVIYYHYLDNPLVFKNGKDLQKGSYLGPEYDDREISRVLDDYKLPYEYLETEELLDKVSDLLIEKNVIGWFQGRMEFGPRALGSRSIIGDARLPDMQKKMNLKIKFRESFRPFAPSVLEEKTAEWFDLDRKSPYMLLVTQVNRDKQRSVADDEQQLTGLQKLRPARSDIPAVTHVDYSARIQTISKEDNPRYYSLISKFDQKTGCPVIINTSFNVRGEPIVQSPQDAYKCFMRTQMDVLVMGNCILYKKEQPEFHDDIDWEQVYELD